MSIDSRMIKKVGFLFRLNPFVIATVITAALFCLALPGQSQTSGGSGASKGDQPLPQMSENGPLQLDIYGGIRDLYKIAVPKPLGHSATAEDIKQISEKALQVSSLFKVLDSNSFIADLSKEGLGITPEPWTTVGAQGVIKGQATVTNGRIELEFRLYEVARGTQPVLSRTYKGGANDVRPSTYKWINEVIKYFTGEVGVFGSKIAFARRTAPGQKDIFTVFCDGSGTSRVTHNGSINLLPAWGPGGSIYYTSFFNGFPNLYRSDKKTAILAEEGLNMGPALSRDGSKMAVVLSRDGNPEIYVSDPQGGNLRRLTNDGAIEVSPTWSPDGSRIAFVSDRHGSPQIFVMNADGSGVKRITFRGTYNQTPVWSPRKDIPLIAFTGRDGGTYDIFTINADTGAMRRLTQNQGTNMDPAWSPDGKLIAFHSSRGGIFLMNAEGLNQNLILPGAAETLKWSPYVP